MAERRTTSRAEHDGDSVDFCIDDIGSRYSVIHPEVEGVVDRVSAINKHVSRAFEDTLAGHGLNHGEYKLLLRLATRSSEHRMSAGDLSRALMLSSGAMTNRLDQLEKAELVRRVPDPRDRRGVLVELTAKGIKQIDEAVTEQAAKEIDVLGALSPRELTTLNQLLRKVLGSLEARAGADKDTAASA
jgi:DNA-binding MarR family transcriptional regulator